jgi:hypothetical protein
MRRSFDFQAPSRVCVCVCARRALRAASLTRTNDAHTRGRGTRGRREIAAVCPSNAQPALVRAAPDPGPAEPVHPRQRREPRGRGNWETSARSMARILIFITYCLEFTGIMKRPSRRAAFVPSTYSPGKFKLRLRLLTRVRFNNERRAVNSPSTPTLPLIEYNNLSPRSFLTFAFPFGFRAPRGPRPLRPGRLRRREGAYRDAREAVPRPGAAIMEGRWAAVAGQNRGRNREGVGGGNEGERWPEEASIRCEPARYRGL